MTYVPEALRARVYSRAAGHYEYCLVSDQFDAVRHHIDHIRATKHHGSTDELNLCLACYECNRCKGSDLGSIDPETDELIHLFNPRRDQWAEHFYLEGAVIVAVSAIGRVSSMLLQFNEPKRILVRQRLIEEGFYPPQLPLGSTPPTS